MKVSRGWWRPVTAATFSHPGFGLVSKFLLDNVNVNALVINTTHPPVIPCLIQWFYSVQALNAIQCEQYFSTFHPLPTLPPPQVNDPSLHTHTALSFTMRTHTQHTPCCSMSCRIAVCCVQYSHLFMSHWPPHRHTAAHCQCAFSCSSSLTLFRNKTFTVSVKTVVL